MKIVKTERINGIDNVYFRDHTFSLWLDDAVNISTDRSCQILKSPRSVNDAVCALRLKATDHRYICNAFRGVLCDSVTLRDTQL